MTHASRAVDPTTTHRRSSLPGGPTPTSTRARRPSLERIIQPPRLVWRLLIAVGAVTVLTAGLLVVQVPPTVFAIDVFGALRQPGEPAFTVGHRGDRATAPENTLPSLELAMDELSFVETDVRLTRDGVPVLFHDVTLERITGDRRTVEELDLATLRELDAGAWYSPEFAGLTIPTLDEFFAALADRADARALVELKSAWSPDEVRRVVGLIEAHGLRGRVVLQSFSIESLLSIRAVSPTTPRIMLIRELPADPVPLAEHLGVIGFGTTAASVTAAPGALERAHAAGVAVLCYTLNTSDHWQEVSALGVDGIITDQPSDLDLWLASTAPGT